MRKIIDRVVGKVEPPLIPSQFFAAVERGDLAAVEEYIRRDPSIVNQISDRSTEPALHTALINKYERIALVLLKNEADPRALGTHNRTALYQACEMGLFDAAKALIRRGVDLDTIDEFAESVQGPRRSIPLTVAMNFAGLEESRCREIVLLLLRSGANTEIAKDAGNTLLHKTCSSSYIPSQIARELIERGASIIAVNDRNETVLSSLISNDLSARCDEILGIMIASGQLVVRDNHLIGGVRRYRYPVLAREGTEAEPQIPVGLANLCAHYNPVHQGAAILASPTLSRAEVLELLRPAEAHPLTQLVNFVITPGANDNDLTCARSIAKPEVVRGLAMVVGVLRDQVESASLKKIAIDAIKACEALGLVMLGMIADNQREVKALARAFLNADPVGDELGLRGNELGLLLQKKKIPSDAIHNIGSFLPPSTLPPHFQTMIGLAAVSANYAQALDRMFQYHETDTRDLSAELRFAHPVSPEIAERHRASTRPQVFALYAASLVATNTLPYFTPAMMNNLTEDRSASAAPSTAPSKVRALEVSQGQKREK